MEVIVLEILLIYMKPPDSPHFVKYSKREIGMSFFSDEDVILSFCKRRIVFFCFKDYTHKAYKTKKNFVEDHSGYTKNQILELNS